MTDQSHTLVAVLRGYDLAVITFGTNENLPPASWSDSDRHTELIPVTQHDVGTIPLEDADVILAAHGYRRVQWRVDTTERTPVWWTTVIDFRYSITEES